MGRRHLFFLMAIGLGLLAPAQALAHSFAIYVSTPLTPPAEFVWLWPISLLVIAGSIFIGLRKAAGVGTVESTCVAVGVVLLFGCVFLFIGLMAASRHTGPPPGLGPPGAIYRRWSGNGLIGLFVVWNAIGLTILAVTIIFLGRLWKNGRHQHMRFIMRFPLLAYCVLLVPYILTGAFAHGWGGGYVMRAGERQLLNVNHACFLYAEDHEGRFPEARDIEELIPQIQPYLKPAQTQHGNPITVHPAAWVFEKQPQAYVWDAAQSGKLAPTIEPFSPRITLPVQCPYAKNGDSVSYYYYYNGGW